MSNKQIMGVKKKLYSSNSRKINKKKLVNTKEGHKRLFSIRLGGSGKKSLIGNFVLEQKKKLIFKK
jgi:hypothetical protein